MRDPHTDIIADQIAHDQSNCRHGNNPNECAWCDLQSAVAEIETLRAQLAESKAECSVACGNAFAYSLFNNSNIKVIADQQAELGRLKAEIETLNNRLAEVKAEWIRPGVMRCAKCNFQLIRSTLNVNRGTVTAGNSDPEPCPNGCGPMWRVTWKEYAQQCDESSDRWADILEAKCAEIEALRKDAIKPIEFFAYDLMEGMTVYENEAEAIEHAQATIDCYREDAIGDGWCEDIEYVCVGVITRKAKQVSTGQMINFDGEHQEAVEYVIDPAIAAALVKPCA